VRSARTLKEIQLNDNNLKATFDIKNYDPSTQNNCQRMLKKKYFAFIGQ
jgi:hypothetical protein